MAHDLGLVRLSFALLWDIIACYLGLLSFFGSWLEYTVGGVGTFHSRVWVRGSRSRVQWLGSGLLA